VILELGWEVSSHAGFFNRLASFSRLIMLNQRGIGMSDRVAGAPTLETRMDDIGAVRCHAMRPLEAVEQAFKVVAGV
jgi:hypothetical protein